MQQDEARLQQAKDALAAAEAERGAAGNANAAIKAAEAALGQARLDLQHTRVKAPADGIVGEVDSLSPASGAAFSLLPPQNATGNWVKVTQRFPVRLHILDPVPTLRVGASSKVTVDTALQSE